MSAQLLATELNNLITESKRKHQDLRQVHDTFEAIFPHLTAAPQEQFAKTIL